MCELGPFPKLCNDCEGFTDDNKTNFINVILAVQQLTTFDAFCEWFDKQHNCNATRSTLHLASDRVTMFAQSRNRKPPQGKMIHKNPDMDSLIKTAWVLSRTRYVQEVVNVFGMFAFASACCLFEYAKLSHPLRPFYVSRSIWWNMAASALDGFKIRPRHVCAEGWQWRPRHVFRATCMTRHSWRLHPCSSQAHDGNFAEEDAQRVLCWRQILET